MFIIDTAIPPIRVTNPTTGIQLTKDRTTLKIVIMSVPFEVSTAIIKLMTASGTTQAPDQAYTNGIIPIK